MEIGQLVQLQLLPYLWPDDAGCSLCCGTTEYSAYMQLVLLPAFLHHPTGQVQQSA